MKFHACASDCLGIHSEFDGTLTQSGPKCFAWIKLSA